MRRFFVLPESLTGDTLELTGEIARRLRTVLRLHAGDEIVLFDGRGLECEAVLETVDRTSVVARVTARREGAGEPRARLILHQALIKGDRFDWVLEKGTELGVAAFVPLIVRRSVVRPRVERFIRAERWQRVITEAAEQSGRSRLPALSPAVPFEDALATAPGLRLLPWEEERSAGLRETLCRLLPRLPDAENPVLSLFIGPEGGFTKEEVDLARAAGVEVVSLGRRILRSETAGIVAAAAVLYELRELGG